MYASTVYGVPMHYLIRYMYRGGGTDRESKETNFLIRALYLGNDYPESD